MCVYADLNAAITAAAPLTTAAFNPFLDIETGKTPD